VPSTKSRIRQKPSPRGTRNPPPDPAGRGLGGPFRDLPLDGAARFLEPRRVARAEVLPLVDHVEVGDESLADLVQELANAGVDVDGSELGLGGRARLDLRALDRRLEIDEEAGMGLHEEGQGLAGEVGKQDEAAGVEFPQQPPRDGASGVGAAGLRGDAHPAGRDLAGAHGPAPALDQRAQVVAHRDRSGRDPSGVPR
jgi:hypothetical protein